MTGNLVFMLHSHLPYFRKVGSRLSGEEWLYEAMAESYIPLLDTLEELARRGLPLRLSLGFTPILLAQLADAYVADRFDEYLAAKIRAAGYDVLKFGMDSREDLLALAVRTKEWYERVRESFHNRHQRNLVATLRRLQETGAVELTASAATHAYLPLLVQESAIRAQLAVGVEMYREAFSRRPLGFWLPECAYRPGLDSHLADLGICYFFVDTHTIEGGLPADRSSAFAARPARPPEPRSLEAPTGRTTFLAYRLANSGVVAFGRNSRVGLQVWSADHGYPGDGWYREFHKREIDSGHKYWRVTDRRSDLGVKALYNPAEALARVREHAAHFTALVAGMLEDFERSTGWPGVVVACYDTELFGHWWFEGVAWLREVLCRCAVHPSLRLTTPSAYLAAHPPLYEVELPESSWGLGGQHYVWFNPATEWLWPLLYEAQSRMEELAELYPDATGDRRRVLNQAAREVLLLQASDWPFLITTGQATDYARDRFQVHLARFRRLADAVGPELYSPSFLAWLAELEESDRLFPNLDYRIFRRPVKGGATSECANSSWATAVYS
ncbi:MAG: glycoside hydrolase family 57 protein [Bacillota bacterium]|nr:glycoside hydrolase family 57 protein [Bacillota bacterium]